MNKKYIFTILVGVSVVLVGCTDDFGQSTLKYTGNEIIFGGRAGFELNENKTGKTRTVYTGNTWTATNEAGETKTYEGVNWIAGDKVRIFCEDAIGTTVADYTVNATNTEAISGTEEHQVSLTKIGGVGLQWGETGEDAEYDFYAVYPSPHQYPLTSEGGLDATVNNSVLNNETTITGTIPVVQTPLKLDSVANGNGWDYIFTPNMQYAYMVAHQKVTNPNKTKSEVYLNFVPIATAVEIELYNGITGYETNLSTLKLTNILISAKDETTPICGDFTADLSKLTDGNADGSYCGIPTNATTGASSMVETGTNTYKQITIPMYRDGLYGDPVNLAPGKSVKFTVFMLPTTNVEDLKITIQGATGAATGSTSGITVNVHKKTYLKKMPITNAVMPFDQSRWVEYLPDNAYLKGLSIPGAGGATSGHITHTDDNKTFLEQSLDIPNLWAHGIRCFEFTVDRSTATTNPDLGTQEVYCNTIPTGVTLKDAVAAVKKQLIDYPNEFAMVIITYQAQTGWETRNSTTGAVTNTNNRSAQDFASQLKDFWDKVSDATYSEWPLKNGIQTGTALYKTDLTVNDARGQLFCIARPTSQGEDNYVKITGHDVKSWLGIKNDWYCTVSQDALPTITTVHPKILVINGWGALKDKWEARGFTPCIFQRGVGNTNFHNAVNHGKFEIFYDADLPGRPYEVANSGTDGLSGTLDVVSYGGASCDGNTYVSSRIKTLVPDFYYDTQAGTTTVTSNGAWVQEWARVSPEEGVKGGSNSNYAWWPSSIEEKKARIEECLDYALKGTKGSDIVYINSLCGYFIDINNWKSCEPNSLTESNIAKDVDFIVDYMGLQPLTSVSSTSGMSGNIEGYAAYINDYFYDYLQRKVVGSDFVPGPMGIILMDRVGEVEASTQIPSIIIANNFQYVLPSKPAAPAALSLPRADLEEGDEIAAPKRRSTSEENSEMKIVWE